MDLNFRVAAPDLETWLKLVESIYDLGFESMRLNSETRGSDGFFIYDMSVRYERNI
jgi:hypothetical protein